MINIEGRRAKVFLILLFSYPAFLMAQDTTRTNQQWQILSVQNLPEKREDCSFVETGGNLYLIGGRGIKPVEVFHPNTNTWEKKSNTPIEMHHFQAIAYKNEIYVVGGMSGNFPHEKPFENIYIYNPAKDEWRKGPAIPEDRRRGSGGTVVYKEKIYFVCGIIDGHYDGTVAWMDVLDPASGKWTTLTDAPHGRDHFHAVILNHRLYLAGGRRTSFKTQQIIQLTVPEVDVYDFGNKTWQTLPATQNLPVQRAGCTAVAYKGKLVVIGGESIAQQSSHNEAEAYDPKSGTWKALPPLKTGRHDTQALVYKNKIYIVAGSANRGGGPDQNTIEVLQ